MKIILILFSAFIINFGAATAKAQAPTIPARHKEPIKCIYGILRSNNAVRSVDIYALDGFRSALEFNYVYADGNVSTEDILLSGTKKDGTTAYGLSSPIRQSDQQQIAHLQFLQPMLERFQSACHLFPAFDNLIPQPPPRSKWQREDFSE